MCDCGVLRTIALRSPAAVTLASCHSAHVFHWLITPTLSHSFAQVYFERMDRLRANAVLESRIRFMIQVRAAQRIEFDTSSLAGLDLRQSPHNLLLVSCKLLCVLSSSPLGLARFYALLPFYALTMQHHTHTHTRARAASHVTHSDVLRHDCMRDRAGSR